MKWATQKGETMSERIEKKTIFNKGLKFGVKNGKSIIAFEAVESDEGTTRRIVIKTNVHGCIVTKTIVEMTKDSMSDLKRIVDEFVKIPNEEYSNLSIRYQGTCDNPFASS